MIRKYFLGSDNYVAATLTPALHHHETVNSGRVAGIETCRSCQGDSIKQNDIETLSLIHPDSCWAIHVSSP